MPARLVIALICVLLGGGVMGCHASLPLAEEPRFFRLDVYPVTCEPEIAAADEAMVILAITNTSGSPIDRCLGPDINATYTLFDPEHEPHVRILPQDFGKTDHLGCARRIRLAAGGTIGWGAVVPGPDLRGQVIQPSSVRLLMHIHLEVLDPRTCEPFYGCDAGTLSGSTIFSLNAQPPKS
jgi:hypothetical protein